MEAKMFDEKFLELWNSTVGAFAVSVGKPDDEITKCLEGVIGEKGEEALNLLFDKVAVPDQDIKTALAELKIPSGKINLHLIKLRGPQPEIVETVAPEKTIGSALSILPTVPDETSFLEMLKTGGVLKVGPTEVLSALKAALAKTVGLYDIPEKLLQKMEAFAETQGEPCGESFYKMQKLLTEKKYGEVLSVLGVSGSYISETRKKAFFAKLNEKLWPALTSFNHRLTEWQQAWMNGMSNPGMLMMAMTANHTGVGLPSGMIAPPDTQAVRAEAEEAINQINIVFAGAGIPVVRALAYDATRIMGILKEDDLPLQVGSANKDQMLKELGINVGADIVRTEQSLTRFALAIMSLSDVSVENEIPYLAAMIQLGATIPWEKVNTKAGIGRNL